jgi:hypothetical protein
LGLKKRQECNISLKNDGALFSLPPMCRFYRSRKRLPAVSALEPIKVIGFMTSLVHCATVDACYYQLQARHKPPTVHAQWRYSLENIRVIARKVTSKTIAASILVLCTNNGNAKNDR